MGQAMSEPTIADVLARLDRIEHAADVRALEGRAALAELRLDVTTLRQEVHDLGHQLRDLWHEHLLHSHPTEES